MGRDGGGHADGNALSAVDQKIRHPDRQDLRLALGLIVVGDKTDRLVQIPQVDILRELLELRLGVTHGRGAIALDGAEVSVAVHQRHAPLEGLAHDHQRLINRRIAVGVIFTHGIADNAGGLSVGLVVGKAQLAHVVEHAPLHRLQAVPGVRDGAGRDDAHGVIEIAFLHLLRVFCSQYRFCHTATALFLSASIL